MANGTVLLHCTLFKENDNKLVSGQRHEVLKIFLSKLLHEFKAKTIYAKKLWKISKKRVFEFGGFKVGERGRLSQFKELPQS